MNNPITALPVIMETVRELAPQGEKIYLVGGAVRDHLLGKACHDFDFVVEGDARPLARRLAAALRADYYTLDAERMTARVLLRAEDGSQRIFDFAALRADDLEGDLLARDFTVNAIAIDIHAPKQLIDPLGGAKDLHAKCLRACSEKAFNDDPLRILRGIRLSLALGYRLDSKTITWMRAAVPALQRVSNERIRDELFRMLGSGQSATAIRLLDNLGILPLILPEILALKGVKQTAPHIWDAWEHSLMTLGELERLYSILCGRYDEEASSSLLLGMAVMQLGRYREQFSAHFEQRLNPNRTLFELLIFAGLYHDIGKPLTHQLGVDGRIHFFQHEEQGTLISSQRAQELALSQVEGERLGILVRNHLRIHLLANEPSGPTRRSIFRFFHAVGDVGVDLVLLALADRLATEGFTLMPQAWERELEVCRMLLESWWERREVELKPAKLINGHDLQEQFGIHPGPQIGKILEALQEAQALGEVTSRAEAFEFTRTMLAQDGGNGLKEMRS